MLFVTCSDTDLVHYTCWLFYRIDEWWHKRLLFQWNW